MNDTSSLRQEYDRKTAAYYAGARSDYVSELPHDAGAAILEIGCGAGATGALALAEGKCGTYVGVEMHEPAAREAERVLTTIHVGNAEMLALPYDEQTFDALICSEVLEHLVDPGTLLKRLVPLLRPGARVFASSPNIAHWRMLLQLMRGRFDYAESGPMDRTHLRWFTPASYRALFEDAGLAVDRVGPLGHSRRISFISSLGPRVSHLAGVQIDLRAHRPRS